MIRTCLRLAALTMGFLVLGACIPAPGAPSTTSPHGGSAPTSTVAPAPTPIPTGPTPSPSFVRPTPTPLPTFLSYVVRPGDNLSSIARAHGTTPRSIAFWNRTSHPSLDPDSPDYEPDRIKVGWVLQLIPGVEIDEDDTFPE